VAEKDQAKPTVYLIHGDDDFSISAYIHLFREKFEDESAAEMDLQRFTSENYDFAALAEACTSLPFLSSRRLVIVSEVLEVAPSGPRLDQLLNLLDRIPPTTGLVLVAHRPLDQDRRGRAQVHPLLRWAKEHPRAAFVRKFATPEGSSFIQWIGARSAQLGGEIQPRAAGLLAELTGENSLLADQELHKLLDYVDRAAPITVQDVEKLTPLSGQADVFAMVDAVGTRRGAQALIHLHRLLETEPVIYAFAMILRQFRLLIQAREAMDRGADPQDEMNTHPYVVRKAAAQARQFSMRQLEEIYRQLLSIDVASKSGGDDLETALDRLIASLTAP
jgi:DNA polymerase-3 subunit delta